MWEKSIFPHFLLLNLLVNVYSKDCLYSEKKLTEKLEKTFDKILSHINGFYYGRLDIRYEKFEDLENGLNFSIIELNGAMSEPTHIYDPKHSFLYGQKEI